MRNIVTNEFANDMYIKMIKPITAIFNPSSREGFSKTYFPKDGCNPLQIINTEGHIILNLLPVYRYGYLLSIDTKINTNHLLMTSLWRHNVGTSSKIKKWSFCVYNIGRNLFLREKS